MNFTENVMHLLPDLAIYSSQMSDKLG